MRPPARESKPSRLEQILQWLAGGLGEPTRHGFGGVIVFDEPHPLANAVTIKPDPEKGDRGDKAPSQQGRTGLQLQNALPDARILYVSATGASALQGLAYASRLGLRGGDDTPFETREQFVTTMEGSIKKCGAIRQRAVELQPICLRLSVPGTTV